MADGRPASVAYVAQAHRRVRHLVALSAGSRRLDRAVQDSPQFRPVVTQAFAMQVIHEVLGDKGYDAEHNHRLCREEFGIPSTLIPVRRKSSRSKNRRWPEAPYRREMKRILRHADFGQRWQVESAFSRHKRRLGAALRARTWLMQQWECTLRVLTHNIMLLAAR